MTRAAISHQSGWACKAWRLWLVVMVIVPLTSRCESESSICLEKGNTLSCFDPPIPLPSRPSFCCERKIVACPDDMLVRSQYVTYTFSITYTRRGCVLNYTVPSTRDQPITIDAIGPDSVGLDTVGPDTVGPNSCSRFKSRNVSYSHPPGYQFPEGLTVVSFETNDSCQLDGDGVIGCSFDIVVENATDFCEMCYRVQTLLIVLLVLNAVGWVCCLKAACVTTAPSFHRSEENGHSRGGTPTSDCNADDDDAAAYVTDLFQNIGASEPSSSRTSSQRSSTRSTGSDHDKNDSPSSDCHTL